MVERSRRRHDVYDNTLTKMIATTAVLAAIAALHTGAAGAVLLDTDGDSASGSAAVVGAERALRDPVPESRHRRRRDALCRHRDASGNRRARHDPVPQPRDRGRRVPVLRRALARTDRRLRAHARVGTRARRAHRRLAADARRHRDRLERHRLVERRRRGWVGLGSGLAAVFAVAVGALYLSTRHRGRVALP